MIHALPYVQRLVRHLTGTLALPALALGLTACATGGGGAGGATAWKARLNEELPLLGHRNWIVVADSAYPAQTSGGVQTVYTGATQLEVVSTVLDALNKTRHVQPKVYLDAELDAVPESLAPGIDQYRTNLKGLLGNRPVERVPHEELIARLDKAGSTFRVLLLKTDLTLPYTSVFLELDCGYWGPEEERQLRAILAR